MGQTTTKSIPILKSLTSVKTIKSPHFSSFETILPLHDTRLASSTENTILIYNPTSNYSLDLTIECPFIITSLAQLPNNHSVAWVKKKNQLKSTPSPTPPPPASSQSTPPTPTKSQKLFYSPVVSQPPPRTAPSKFGAQPHPITQPPLKKLWFIKTLVLIPYYICKRRTF